MKSRELPAKEVLDRVLKYDPQTGELFWRPRSVETLSLVITKADRPSWSSRPSRSVGIRAGIGPRGERSSEWTCNQWNSRWAGKPATTLKSDGYRYVHLNYRTELAHRIAYKIMTGVDPTVIDHIDGNRSNNKWSNLRNGSHTDNFRNLRLKSNNKSGCHGVHFSKRQQRWVAMITIGSFDDREAAIEARKKAEALFGFHANHGRKAEDREN